MGNFYVNYTVKHSDHKAVAEVLSGRSAYLTHPKDGCIVVIDKQSDEQNPDEITELGVLMSKKLSCPVLSVLNHDDGILWYRLFDCGEVMDTYDSAPDYFDPGEEPADPEGGDACKICSAFSSGNNLAVENILRKSSFDDDGYIFAMDRHADLVSALGLPAYSVGLGYNYAEQGDLPPGMKEDDLIKVGNGS